MKTGSIGSKRFLSRELFSREKVDPRSRIAISYRDQRTLQGAITANKESTLKKHNNSPKKSEPTSRRTKARGPVQRDTKEVLVELVGKLKKKLDRNKVVAPSAEESISETSLAPISTV